MQNILSVIATKINKKKEFSDENVSKKLSEKEAISNLRKDIKKFAAIGGQEQRYRLLAYGYLRGRMYAALESKTEGDNLCNIGKHSFYGGLSASVAIVLEKYLKAKEFKTNEISNWMKERWESK